MGVSGRQIRFPLARLELSVGGPAYAGDQSLRGNEGCENTLTDDGKDRATQDEQKHGDPQSQRAMEAALASAQRLVSAAERFGRAGPDDVGPGPEPGEPEPGGPGLNEPGSGGDPSAEFPVPAETDRPDPASEPEDGQPEPDLIPWSRTAEPVSRRKRRRAADPHGDVGAGHGSHARSVPGSPPDSAGLDLRPVTNTELVARLTPELLLRPRRRVPSAGWRRTIYRSSLGLVRVPPGRLERRRLELIARARTPVGSGHHRVAILSMKGGVGKTTTTVTLGLTLASLRSDRIIALDANPDRGTLADKLTAQPRTSIRDLLEHRLSIERYADVRGFTAQTASRLEVLTSDQNPATAAAFSEADYRTACGVLERFYSVCLTDCGTGLMHSAMTGALGLADQIILVTTPAVDSARSAGATIDWLTAHGHEDLAAGAVVVLNALRRTSGHGIDMDVLAEQFAARCRAVIRIPYDPYLDQGASVELDQLARETSDAFLQLAAAVGDGFTRRRTELELAR
jgi:MinD-like ATPase involved in chromosome partitioning or flagellar assembly